MLLPAFPAIFLTLQMLAIGATALPKPAVSILPNLIASISPASNTILTPRAISDSLPGPNPGLSAKFIASMNKHQLSELIGRLKKARDAFLWSGLKKDDLGLDLAVLIKVIEDARDEAPLRGSGSMSREMAERLAEDLQQYGEAVSQLEDSDKSVVAMKKLFAELSPDMFTTM